MAGAVAGLTQDVRDPASHRLVAEEAARHGVLTAWFNNAGVGDDGALVALSEEQVRRLVEVNLLGTTWGTRTALAAFGAAGGDVVNIASLSGLGPVPGYSMYAATKAALNNLVVNLAQELGAKGTRVNAVAPGPIWTPLIPATMGSDKVEGFGADTPLGRPGQPVEVAAAYVFLASDEASYISGTVLGVTGGKPVF